MLHTAKSDLLQIVDYLSTFSETIALKQYDTIIETINNLKRFPFIHEEYIVNLTKLKFRRALVGDYFVFYVILEDSIEIHRILHSKRNIIKMLTNVKK